jgi:hypothetical protein
MRGAYEDGHDPCGDEECRVHRRERPIVGLVLATVVVVFVAATLIATDPGPGMRH